MHAFKLLKYIITLYINLYVHYYIICFPFLKIQWIFNKKLGNLEILINRFL